MSNQIDHHIDLPDGAVPLAAVELVEYLDPDSGERVYGFRHVGSSAVSTVLGLIELMKRKLLADAHFQDE